MKWSWVIATLLPAICWANPAGPSLESGSAAISYPEKNLCLIQANDQTIINWNDFSIAQGELTRFIQPSEQAVVLNRVTSNNPSQIFGALEANGRIFLVNPYGILFGETAVIQVGEFLTSTLSLLSEDFLNGKRLVFEATSNEALINHGTVRARSGNVTLISRTIVHDGVIETPTGTTEMIASTEVLLCPQDKKRITIRPNDAALKEGIGIDCGGQIHALATHLEADGDLYELAIKQDGKIDADCFCETKGRIYLTSDKGSLSLRGQLSAAQGSMLFEGKTVLIDHATLSTSDPNHPGIIEVQSRAFTYVDASSHLSSNATKTGDGGTILCESDGITLFEGVAEVKGGALAGNGGFIEVSGAQGTHFFGTTDRRAPQGVGGTLLLDPEANFTIMNTFNHNYKKAFGTYVPTSHVANLTIDTLLEELSKGPVVIQTSYEGEGGMPGHILVSSDVTHLYDSPYTLTFDARGDEGIIWNGHLVNQGKGAIELLAPRGGIHFKPTSSDIPALLETAGDVRLGTKETPIQELILIQGGHKQMAGVITTGNGSLSVYGKKGLTLMSAENAPAVMQVHDGSLFMNMRGDILLKGYDKAKAELRSLGSGDLIINSARALNLNAFSGPAQISSAYRQGNITIQNVVKGIQVNAHKAPAAIEAGNGAIRLKNVGFQLHLSADQAAASIHAHGPISIDVPASIHLDCEEAPAFIGSNDTVSITTDKTLLVRANQTEAAIRSRKGLWIQAHEDVLLSGTHQGKACIESPNTCVLAGKDLELLSQTHIQSLQGPLLLSVGKDCRLSNPEQIGDPRISGMQVRMSVGQSLHLKDHACIDSTAGSLTVSVSDTAYFEEASRLRALGGALELVAMGGNIHFTQNAGMEASSDSIHLVSGKSVIFDGFSSAKSYGEKGMTVIVDQLHPNGLGEGGLILSAQATLETGDAPLNLYTAKRSQNAVDGTMNGMRIARAPLFLNTKEEQWGVFFPEVSTTSFLTSAPFVVLYKETGPIQIGVQGVSQLTHDRMVINYIGPFISELFRDLAPYDTFIADTESFTAEHPFVIKRRFFPHRFVPPIQK